MSDWAIVASGLTLVAALLAGVAWLAASSVASGLETRRAACLHRGGTPVTLHGPRVVCFAPGIVIAGDH